MIQPLIGHIAIVTGASRERGIGTAICRALAKAGADILFTHWGRYDETMSWGAEQEWPDRLMDELKQTGVRAHHLEVDLADPSTPSRIFDRALEVLGRPSILVNNATHSNEGGFRELSAESLDAH